MDRIRFLNRNGMGRKLYFPHNFCTGLFFFTYREVNILEHNLIFCNKQYIEFMSFYLFFILICGKLIKTRNTNNLQVLCRSAVHLDQQLHKNCHNPEYKVIICIHDQSQATIHNLLYEQLCPSFIA